MRDALDIKRRLALTEKMVTVKPDYISERLAAEYPDLATELEEGQRLKSLGIIDDEAILKDIDSVIERRRMSRLREAILFVIDEGDPTTKEPGEIRGLPWALDHPFEPIADEARIRFCEEVEKRFR